MERISLRRVTLCVAPLRNEGFGLTPLDVRASKTAVVASDAGAYKELVTEGTGTVVPAGDGKALTEAIKPYLADPEKTIAMGEKALEHVQKDFSLDKDASSIDEVYQELFATK
ncbi:mannosyltransferase [Bartonella apihabitans]|uniref:Mannosyltransferase n=1 Tax=Bartonella apihabitans TaxID=2750929 RepID=A0A1U9MCN0_9HYPH|nr:mannosyltransferase [Bartonella apihabitans]